jgi:hypothetical protein
MDLARLSDPKYIAELSAAAKSRGADSQYTYERLSLLDRLASEWGPGHSPRPDSLLTSSITVDEFVAIALAVKRVHEFNQPVAQFNVMQPWLQSWVLQRLNLEQYAVPTEGSA